MFILVCCNGTQKTNKKVLCIPFRNTEDEKFPWYHLSLPPCGGLIRPHQVRALYRALPSSPTAIFSEAAPKGIPHSAPTALHRPAVL